MVKKITLIAYTIALIIQANASQGGWEIKPFENPTFIENKGQFNVRHAYLAEKDVKFTVSEITKFIHLMPSGVIYHFQDIQKNPYRERGEKEKARYVIDYDFVEFEWEGALKTVSVKGSEIESAHHTYTFNNAATGQVESIENVNAFKKVVYENLYPDIDVVYEIHPQGGIKYSLLLKPGANPSIVRMKYGAGRELSVDASGKLHISTKFGDIIEHAPVTFYSGNSGNEIKSAFKIVDNTVQFELSGYDNTKAIVIDPWVQTPNFNTQWKCVWECESDAAGNAYLIGGVMPLQLMKFNNAGVLQWTYNTPYDTSNTWLGNFAVDNAGNSFVTEGTGGGRQRISTAGTLVWNANSSPGGLLNEFWSITFNCDQTRLIIGGTGGTLNPEPWIFDINQNTGAVIASRRVTGPNPNLFGGSPQEVRAVAACDNGRYYFLSHDSIGYLHESLSSCLAPNQLPYHVSNTYGFGYKCENFRKDNTGIAAMKYHDGFVYTHRGNRLDKREFATANIVQSVNIPGGQWNTGGFGAGNSAGCSGVDIDECGNIYVGATNGVVKFNSNMVQQAVYTTAFNVYDVAVAANGDIVAGGSTGTSASGARTGYIQSFAAAACAKKTTQVCCDPTICPVPPLCTTDGPVTISVTTPGGTFSGPGVNPTTGVFNPSVAGPGTHKIIYTLACGADSVNIVVSPCGQLAVCREQNGSYTVSGGVNPYTWAKDTVIQNCSACFIGCLAPPGCAVNQNTFVNFATGSTITPPGTFPLSVTDASGTTFIIPNAGSVQPCTQCPTITVTPSAQQNPACGQTNGSATFTATGGTGNYTYIWSPNVSTLASASNLAAGTYNVTATDANGCTGTGTVTLTNPNSPTLSTSNQVNPGCGQSNGSVSVTLAGGTGPYQISISDGVNPPQNQTSPVAGTLPVTGLAAGTYTINVTDANQCTATTSVTMTPPNSPTVSVSTTAETCLGDGDGTATATASGGTGTLTYLWSNNATTPGVTGLAAGTYSVTVTDASNCTATASGNVANGPICCNISLAATITQPTCGQSDGSISIIANPSAGYVYTWSGGLPNQASQTNLAAGSYSVTVSLGNCSEDTTINLNPSNGPQLTFSNITNPGCGQSNGSVNVTLAGGVAPYQVTISDGVNPPQNQTIPFAGTAPLSGLPAGSYTVTVTDASTCSSTQQFQLTQPLPPVINNISATGETCQGNNDGTVTVTAFGGTGTLTYLWSNNATTASINNLSPGAYTVTVTDANGCTVVGAATINAGPVCCNLSLSYTSVQPACGAADGSIDLIINGGSGNYTINWNTGETAQNISSLASGTYTVTVTDITQNCTEDTFVNLSTAGAPVISNIAATNESCDGANDGSLNAIASGGTPPYNYLWSNSSTTNPATGLAPGSYSLTITDADGCEAFGNASIQTGPDCCPLRIAATGVDPSCGLDNGSINVTITAQGTTPYNYSLNGNPPQTTGTFTGLADGTYLITVIDATLCIDTVTVILNPGLNNLDVQLTATDVSCFGEQDGTVVSSITGGTAPYTYTWQTSPPTTTPNLDNVGIGTYVVNVSDALGCTGIANATVSQPQQLQVVMPNDTTVCEGSEVILSAQANQAPVDYTWSNGENGPVIIVDMAGVYTVVVSSNPNCTVSGSTTINTIVPPVIDAGEDKTVYFGQSVSIQPMVSPQVSGDFFTWQPADFLSCTNCLNTTSRPADTITYVITYNNNGCISQDTITVFVINNFDIYIPNIFSPNGDGRNDFFFPIGNNVKKIVWKMFNRWGEKMYESNSMDEVWDGTHNGKLQPPGVYVYIMNVTFLNEEERIYKGSVTLVR